MHRRSRSRKGRIDKVNITQDLSMNNGHRLEAQRQSTQAHAVATDPGVLTFPMCNPQPVGAMSHCRAESHFLCTCAVNGMAHAMGLSVTGWIQRACLVNLDILAPRVTCKAAWHSHGPRARVPPNVAPLARHIGDLNQWWSPLECGTKGQRWQESRQPWTPTQR